MLHSFRFPLFCVSDIVYGYCLNRLRNRNEWEEWVVWAITTLFCLWCFNSRCCDTTGSIFVPSASLAQSALKLCTFRNFLHFDIFAGGRSWKTGIYSIMKLRSSSNLLSSVLTVGKLSLPKCWIWNVCMYGHWSIDVNPSPFADNPGKSPQWVLSGQTPSMVCPILT